MPWKDVVALLEAGNVIGSHGIDHRSFDDLGADESAEQLEGSRELIEQRIGYRPTSFAFPFGAVRPSSGDAGAFARRWYDEVHLSDNRLALGELTDGVFNRRHAEFGTCAYRGIAVGGLNVLFGIRKWRS
jgi:peptidoglycan/xylan/chitin deacetylase (PgdA/CDA1 family)